MAAILCVGARQRRSISGRRFHRPAGSLTLAAASAATVALLLCGASVSGQAWAVGPVQVRGSGEAVALRRRDALGATLAAATWWQGSGNAAHASGGSTAGKYSTIPAAKRRFYGRVKQGIYQFLQLEQPIVAGTLDDPLLANFFAKTIIKQEGGKRSVSCAIDLGGCESKEIRTSRWNDFKAASDLLASAFRYSSEDVNDRLPQVKVIRAYAKKIEKMKIAIEGGDAATAQQLYANAKKDLSRYVPQVELAALNSEDYTHEWDTRPQVICTGNFCT